jgi:hypothetical protein
MTQVDVIPTSCATRSTESMSQKVIQRPIESISWDCLLGRRSSRVIQMINIAFHEKLID